MTVEVDHIRKSTKKSDHKTKFAGFRPNSEIIGKLKKLCSHFVKLQKFEF